jgi:hypothetical protein
VEQDVPGCRAGSAAPACLWRLSLILRRESQAACANESLYLCMSALSIPLRG